jgi:hypothetical protein
VRRGVIIVLALVGCSRATTYTPQHIARHELTLAYDSRMQIHAGRELLTEGPQYDGLEHYVRCVPAARAHARAAEQSGRTGVAFAWTGGTLGVLSLGGLAGFAYLENDPPTAFAILGAGLGVSALGITFAAMSRTFRNQAHGHAVDALNYYNDAVGSHGGSCDAPLPPAALLPSPHGVAAPSKRAALSPRGG